MKTKALLLLRTHNGDVGTRCCLQQGHYHQWRRRTAKGPVPSRSAGHGVCDRDPAHRQHQCPWQHRPDCGATGFNLALTSCPTTGLCGPTSKTSGWSRPRAISATRPSPREARTRPRTWKCRSLPGQQHPHRSSYQHRQQCAGQLQCHRRATLYHKAPSTSPPAPSGAGLALWADLIYSLDYHLSLPHEASPASHRSLAGPGTASSGCALLLLSRQAWGHVQISGTRVIYPANAREVCCWS